MNMIQFVTHWMPLLDAAARIVAIIGVVGLGFAYCSYRHSVRIAERNERRASVELAARECDRYGRELLKQLADLGQEIERSGCDYVRHCKLIKEDQQLKLDASAVTQEDREKIRKHSAQTMCVLNSLEGFAIPFASRVADDRVGFIECGSSFVDVFEKIFPLYCLSNLQHYYKSSQEIYWRWKKQLDQEELEREHAQAGKEFFVLTEKLVRGKSNSRVALWVAAKLKELSERVSQTK